MKKVILNLCLSLSALMVSCGGGQAQVPAAAVVPVASQKIQVALLLDASNSMDGLIDQAKSRLWNIVNTLTTLKYQGKPPAIEIALYIYGNDGLRPEDNYIKQVTPFTSSLDLISEKLFAITTNGGSEYCGAVIEECVKKLDWGRESSDMKLVFIAGNEPFNQGKVNYAEAISSALAKDIYINTIYCGSYESGIREFWQDGASKGKGKYFCINSNQKVEFVATPYDDRINQCNERLNKTYIYYGIQGASNYANQQAQDSNAESISMSNKTERSVSKSKKGFYKNTTWDLVDKSEEDPDYLKKVDKKSLPKDYQNYSDEQLKAEVGKKNAERSELQKEIAQLSIKRQDYIDQQTKASDNKDDLGAAIKTSILELANTKGYVAE